VWGGATAALLSMNFRLVWMGPDDDPQAANQALSSALSLQSSRAVAPYAQRGPEMVRQEKLQGGRLKITPVANFHACIVCDILIDDGEQERREFGIEAVVGETRLAFFVSAAEFGRMSWVASRLGPQAILYPGQQQHARAAIQWLSGQVRQERIFSYTGWKKHGTQWMYLHAGGALGADGLIPGIQVRLPDALQAFEIGLPQDSDDRGRNVKASLRVLQVAPDRISFPLLAGVYRAALGGTTFSLFLEGRSGVFKTTLAALCQQHFGVALDATRLPANFASTANALESLAFHAKDALLVADDFAPTGLEGDRGLHGLAERLFRAAGNQQGRSRLSNGGRPSAAKPPRALVLATGEDVPKGQSIRARLLIIDVTPGEVDCATLTECQEAAQQGQLAAAMGSFLRWVAGRHDSVQQRLRARVQEIRNQGRGRSIHARLPGATAELEASFEIFLEFALEIGAIGKVERDELLQRCPLALNELVARQAQYHQASDPAARFLGLLRAALAGGRAHVSSRDGKVPDDPAAWGWHRKSAGRPWVPQGARIGWLAVPDLYLEPAASYEVAQQMAGSERLPITEQKLRHRLREQDLLASVDSARHVLLVRRTLEGRPRQVLHLRARDL